MRPILIRGGRVIDPARGTDEVTDVYIADGKIQASGRDLGGRTMRSSWTRAARWWPPG